jgi:hypothetical protein
VEKKGTTGHKNQSCGQAGLQEIIDIYMGSVVQQRSRGIMRGRFEPDNHLGYEVQTFRKFIGWG